MGRRITFSLSAWCSNIRKINMSDQQMGSMLQGNEQEIRQIAVGLV